MASAPAQATGPIWGFDLWSSLRGQCIGSGIFLFAILGFQGSHGTLYLFSSEIWAFLPYSSWFLTGAESHCWDFTGRSEQTPLYRAATLMGRSRRHLLLFV